MKTVVSQRDRRCAEYGEGFSLGELNVLLEEQCNSSQGGYQLEYKDGEADFVRISSDAEAAEFYEVIETCNISPLHFALWNFGESRRRGNNAYVA